MKNHIPSTAPTESESLECLQPSLPLVKGGGGGNWYEWPGQHLHQEVLDPAPQSQQSQSYIIAPIVFAQTGPLRFGAEDECLQQQKEQYEDHRGLTEVAPKPELSLYKE